jgi:hypothetical protein
MRRLKIQRFMSGIRTLYSDKIHYGNPRTFEEAIRKEKHLYE